MKKNLFDAKRTALTGILGGLSLALSALEGALMPDIWFLPPGAKPGLSNIVVMFSARTLGALPTVFIILIKSVFALLTRGGTAFLMSLSGGLLSGMIILIMTRLRLKSVSLTGIGILSACFHNMGQLLISVFITGTGVMWNYAPFLLLFGLVTGAVTGTVLNVVLPRTEKIIGNHL